MRPALLALGLLVAAAGAPEAAAGAQSVPAVALRRGEVAFVGRSTIVGEFGGRAPVGAAALSGSDLRQVSGYVEFRVADLATGNRTRDRHLREAMEADEFPTIRFDLTAVEPGAARGDTLGVTLSGNLTIHGVTRSVSVPGQVVVKPASVFATASFPLDMRDYGIRPPVRGLGALRVAPLVTVTVRLGFGEP